MKICSKCGQSKEESEYFRRKDTGRLRTYCKECQLAHNKTWRDNNLEVKQESDRRWRENNKERNAENKMDWKRRNQFSVVLSSSRTCAKKKGWVACSATVKELEVAFTGKCAVCGVSEVECNMRLAMDHCHKTGFFRGWLCVACNTAIGMLKDDPELLLRAVEYLENAKGKLD